MLFIFIVASLAPLIIVAMFCLIRVVRDFLLEEKRLHKTKPRAQPAFLSGIKPLKYIWAAYSVMVLFAKNT